MTPTYYKSVYHKTAQNTAIFALLDDSADSQALANQFMQKDTIDSVSIYSDLADTFQDMISSLNIVVVVLTISAGLLAFVVLYKADKCQYFRTTSRNRNNKSIRFLR